MNVIEKLKQSIEQGAGIPFIYGKQGDINTALDNAPIPCAFSYLLETNAVTDTNGICRERLTIAVFFIDKTQYDFDAIENEDIIDRCKTAAFLWYTQLRMNDQIRPISINNTMRVYDELADVTVTGYTLNITIEEIQGIGKCNLMSNS